ncbi:uncharacterized protein RHOBADRAFT_55355, partial [Rhodotorula graminis WP1]
AGFLRRRALAGAARPVRRPGLAPRLVVRPRPLPEPPARRRLALKAQDVAPEHRRAVQAPPRDVARRRAAASARAPPLDLRWPVRASSAGILRLVLAHLSRDRPQGRQVPARRSPISLLRGQQVGSDRVCPGPRRRSQGRHRLLRLGHARQAVRERVLLRRGRVDPQAALAAREGARALPARDCGAAGVGARSADGGDKRPPLANVDHALCLRPLAAGLVAPRALQGPRRRAPPPLLARRRHLSPPRFDPPAARGRRPRARKPLRGRQAGVRRQGPRGAGLGGRSCARRPVCGVRGVREGVADAGRAGTGQGPSGGLPRRRPGGARRAARAARRAVARRRSGSREDRGASTAEQVLPRGETRREVAGQGATRPVTA